MLSVGIIEQHALSGKKQKMILNNVISHNISEKLLKSAFQPPPKFL
jgi:hypothetical protein